MGEKTMMQQTEVEDIMYDQRIITAELNVDYLENTSTIVLSATKLRLVVALVARTVLPAVINTYYSYLRNQQIVLETLRRNQIFPSLLTFIANSLSKSLASVHKGITYPLALRKNRNRQEPKAIEYNVDDDGKPEKSVTIEILAEPEDNDKILVDIIFIHGLHGGLDRTWKQGEWRHNGHKLKDQSPVRRQSSGDLFVPPKKASLKRTISDIYSKVPSKIARKNNQTCVDNNAQWEIIEVMEHSSECWPKDWLPQDIPNSRVIAINYTTDVLWAPIWTKKRNRTDMVKRSQEMIEGLVKINVGKKPIIWAGHSKGGLFIKQIILNAIENNGGNEDVLNIYRQSKGIMFYAVPHKGSTLADCTLPLLRRSVEVLEIQRNCDFVLDLHRRFLEICKREDFKPEIFSFIETSFTFMSIIYLKIVAYDSADPEIGVKCDVPLNHKEICKPAGRDCFLYLELIKMINNCLRRDNL